jgi:phosphate transport system ATP-binding protein
MEPKIKVRNLSAYYGPNLALRNINMEIYPNQILAIIGPARSGKTTFLRSLNRLSELDPTLRVEGQIYLDGIDICQRGLNVAKLRSVMGMVFAIPTPLPGSIYENVALGPRLNGIRKSAELDRRVQESLKAAYLWEEVKDRLRDSVFTLSGGQQQRLCLARTLALKPEVLLLDEPCSGLDPVSTAKIEEALYALKQNYTIVLVTNNVKQAARASDMTAFFLLGELIEYEPTSKLFTIPKDTRTEEYISGRFG